DRPLPSQVLDRRMAPVMERVARRYVARRTAAGRAQRGRALRQMAAAAAAHASRTHLPLGDLGPRRRRFRDLDEDGHAIHRQLESCAGLEDSAADDSPRAYRPRSQLNGHTKMHLIPTPDEVLTVLRDTGALRDGHFEYPGGMHSNEYLQVPLAMRYYQH